MQPQFFAFAGVALQLVLDGEIGNINAKVSAGRALCPKTLPGQKSLAA